MNIDFIYILGIFIGLICKLYDDLSDNNLYSQFGITDENKQYVDDILKGMFIIGYKVRIAAGILSIFCLLTAFIFHFDFADQIQLILFLKNIGLAGGFLFIVVNGTKEWSLDKEKKFVRL